MHVIVEELPTDTYKMTPRYEQIGRFIPIEPLERRSGITEVEPALSSEEAKEQARFARPLPAAVPRST